MAGASQGVGDPSSSSRVYSTAADADLKVSGRKMRQSWRAFGDPAGPAAGSAEAGTVSVGYATHTFSLSSAWAFVLTLLTQAVCAHAAWWHSGGKIVILWVVSLTISVIESDALRKPKNQL